MPTPQLLADLQHAAAELDAARLALTAASDETTPESSGRNRIDAIRRTLDKAAADLHWITTDAVAALEQEQCTQPPPAVPAVHAQRWQPRPPFQRPRARAAASI